MCIRDRKKPIDDLTKEFSKLRKNKSFIKKRDFYFNNYIGAPTRFIKLENLSKHLGGAQIWAKVVSDANGGAHKNIMLLFTLYFVKVWEKNTLLVILEQDTQARC